MSSYVAALDVGGTGMKGALLDDQARVVEAMRFDTDRSAGPQAMVGQVLAAATAVVDAGRQRFGGDPVGLGVAVLGVVDEDRGTAVRSVAAGWSDVPLRDLLERATGVPVLLAQDVRAGALAEYGTGAGAGFDEMLFLALGTGIGGAYVANGRIHRGTYSRAVEIGHVVVVEGGHDCPCGKRGCLERYASASAVAREFSARSGRDASAAGVADAVRAGDPIAAGVWAHAVEALASGLDTAITLFDPGVVVLGGGLSRAGGLLLDPVTAALADRYSLGTPPPVRIAATGDQAGVIGAGLLALQAHPG